MHMQLDVDVAQVRVHGVIAQRQLVRDVKITGLSLAEAGVRAGMSEGAAKVALHRAMKTLSEGRS